MQCMTFFIHKPDPFGFADSDALLELHIAAPNFRAIKGRNPEVLLNALVQGKTLSLCLGSVDRKDVTM